MPDHFDILAPFYDRAIPPPDQVELAARLALPVAGRLLDVGGGTGRGSAPLRDLVGQVVVSDRSRRMLGEARAKGRLAPVQAHAERLPFPDGSFERVLVMDALHHFCDQREALGDLLRVLKPGGRLVIEEPDLNLFGAKVMVLVEKLALMRSHLYAPQDIRDMLAGHGGQARIETDGRFAAWVVVDK